MLILERLFCCRVVHADHRVNSAKHWFSTSVPTIVFGFGQHCLQLLRSNEEENNKTNKNFFFRITWPLKESNLYISFSFSILFFWLVNMNRSNWIEDGRKIIFIVHSTSCFKTIKMIQQKDVLWLSFYSLFFLFLSFHSIFGMLKSNQQRRRAFHFQNRIKGNLLMKLKAQRKCARRKKNKEWNKISSICVFSRIIIDMQFIQCSWSRCSNRNWIWMQIHFMEGSHLHCEKNSISANDSRNHNSFKWGLVESFD